MIQAKKSLGQHFLTSKKALAEMVEAGDISASDTIIEIGPGEGVLTERILEAGPAKLIAVEKDDRLIPILGDKFSQYVENGTFKIIHGDVLENLEGLVGEITGEGAGGAKKGKKDEKGPDYKIIANIPYYISGILMRKIFELPILPSKVVLLVQKEVADRIVANDKKESMLSVSVKLYGDVRRASIVPKGAFVPAPNVDSAIICIENIRKPLDAKQEKAYFELAKAAFSHKRKRLAKNVEGVQGKSALEWEKSLEKLGFDKNVRAEDLSVKAFIELL